MTLTSSPKLQTQRLVNLGVHPRLAGSLMATIMKWTQCSGEEWTVNRLKAIYQYYLRRSYRVARKDDGWGRWLNKASDGTLKGPFGRLMRHRDRSVVLRAMRIYTAFIASRPTKAQLEKFYSSMEASISELELSHARNLGASARYAFTFSIRSRERVIIERSTAETVLSPLTVSDHGRIRDANNDTVIRGAHIQNWMCSRTRRCPILDSDGRKLWISRKAEIDTTVEEQARPIPLTYWLWGDWLEHLIPADINDDAAFAPVYDSPTGIRWSPESYRYVPHAFSGGGYENWYLRQTFAPNQLPVMAARKEENRAWRSIIGTISFIQEPGYKLRAVANPFRFVQAILFPISIKLWSALRDIEFTPTGSYVFDQELGLKSVREFFSDDWDDEKVADREVWSIDLSDATNHFPWAAQAEFLKGFLTPLEISALTVPTTGSWLCPDGTLRRFGRGQPLGLHFSFAAFHLTHWGILRSLSDKAYPGSRSRPRFAVVGDDVVIRGRRLAKSYIDNLKAMGVPFSKEKSMSSFTTAEFLSKVITATSITMLPKWREVTVANVLSLLTFDPGSSKLLPPHMRKVIDWWASLPQPLGLGINPKGLSWEARLCNEMLWRRWFDRESGMVGLQSYQPFPSVLTPPLTFVEGLSRFGDVTSTRRADYGRNAPTFMQQADRPLFEDLPEWVVNKYAHFLSLFRQGLLGRDNIIHTMYSEDRYPAWYFLCKEALDRDYTSWSPSRPGSAWKSVKRMYKEVHGPRA